MHRSVQVSVELPLSKILTGEVNPVAILKKFLIMGKIIDVDIETHTHFVYNFC